MASGSHPSFLDLTDEFEMLTTSERKTVTNIRKQPSGPLPGSPVFQQRKVKRTTSWRLLSSFNAQPGGETEKGRSRRRTDSSGEKAEAEPGPGLDVKELRKQRKSLHNKAMEARGRGEVMQVSPLLDCHVR